MSPSQARPKKKLGLSSLLVARAAQGRHPCYCGKRGKRLSAAFDILLRHQCGIQRATKTRSSKGLFQTVATVTTIEDAVLEIEENGTDQAVAEARVDGSSQPSSSGRNWDGEKLLKAAAEGSMQQAKQILLRNAEHAKYADPATGLTPLAAACDAGHDDMVKLLLAHEADTYAYSNEGVSPLMLAARGGHASIVKRLLEAGADAFHLAYDTGRTALMDAAAAGSEACIQLLLTLGYADVRSATEDTGTHALLEAALFGHLGSVKALLAAGAKVNQADKLGRTALLAAARRGDARMTEVLLQHRAKSIAEFDLKRTPLMEAACNGHASVVALLLTAEGTDTEAVDAHGNTALALAGTPAVRAMLQLQRPSKR